MYVTCVVSFERNLVVNTHVVETFSSFKLSVPTDAVDRLQHMNESCKLTLHWR